MKSASVLALVLVSIVCSAAVLAVELNQSVDEMVLKGGRFGNVPFGHKTHHAAINDCTMCHDLFPKARGSIARLKSEGRLYRRQVMNQCTSCHFDRAKKGKKTGPTRCGGCHRKR